MFLRPFYCIFNLFKPFLTFFFNIFTPGSLDYQQIKSFSSVFSFSGHAAISIHFQQFSSGKGQESSLFCYHFWFVFPSATIPLLIDYDQTSYQQIKSMSYFFDMYLISSANASWIQGDISFFVNDIIVIVFVLVIAQVNLAGQD